jgi:flagellar biosynthesis protein FlhA
MTAGILTMFALIPGMPALPFLALAGALGSHAWRSRAAERAKAAGTAEGGAPAPAGTKTEEIEASLPLDMLALEVGYELIPAIEATLGGTLLERIGSIRRQFAADLGIIVPPIRIRDNLQLEPSAYRFVMLGTELASGRLRQGRLLAMNPAGSAPDIDGEKVTDPVFHTPARWILPRDRELAEALGYTVVDHATVMATHLNEIVRSHADQLLGRIELSHLFEVFSQKNPKLTDELVPNLLSIGEVLKVMRNLLRESISIRDLRTILESLAEAASATKDSEQLTDIVRQKLTRQITASFRGPDGVIHAMILDPMVEEMFRRSLREIATGTGGALDPEEVRRLGVTLEAAVARQRNTGRTPVLVTSPDLRRYVRAFVERRSPSLSVVSFREIEPTTTIRPVETLSTARAA